MRKKRGPRPSLRQSASVRGERPINAAAGPGVRHPSSSSMRLPLCGRASHAARESDYTTSTAREMLWDTSSGLALSCARLLTGSTRRLAALLPRARELLRGEELPSESLHPILLDLRRLIAQQNLR